MADNHLETTVLEEHAQVIMGQSPPSEFVSDVAGKGMPFLQGNAEFTTLYPVPRMWCSRPSKTSRAGDVLISVRAPVGAINRTEQDYCIGRGLAAVRFLRVVPDYGYHVLCNFGVDLRRVAQGTTFEAISGSDLRHLAVPKHSRIEQRRIAEILDTVDEAIRRTEQVIEKLQQMKQGLLHDLLTRGIDDNGELRPPPEEAPYLYKDSPLGLIPREWVVRRVEDLLELQMDYRGRTPRKLGLEWGGGNIPALSARNVRMGGVDLSLETYYGSERLYGRWMTTGDTAEGDVLLTTEAPLGNIAQVPNGLRYILSQRVVLFRFIAAQASNDFMAMQLAQSRAQTNMKRWSTGTTATGIQMAKMVLVPLACPPIAEQKTIAEAARSTVLRLQKEQDAVRKLRTLKKGLMNDLLTGSVRVNVPEGEC